MPTDRPLDVQICAEDNDDIRAMIDAWLQIASGHKLGDVLHALAHFHVAMIRQSPTGDHQGYAMHLTKILGDEFGFEIESDDD